MIKFSLLAFVAVAVISAAPVDEGVDQENLCLIKNFPCIPIIDICCGNLECRSVIGSYDANGELFHKCQKSAPQCILEGDRCEETEECCDELECQRGKCQEPAPQCIPLDGECEETEECCDELECQRRSTNTAQGKKYCLEPAPQCILEGDKCEETEECCDDLECQSGKCQEPAPQCILEGDKCEETEECCDDLECQRRSSTSDDLDAEHRNKYCLSVPQPQCIPEGDKCEETEECCDDLECQRRSSTSDDLDAGHRNKYCLSVPQPPITTTTTTTTVYPTTTTTIVYPTITTTTTTIDPTPTIPIDPTVYGILGPVRISAELSDNYTDTDLPLVTKCAQKYWDEEGIAHMNFTEEVCENTNTDNTTIWFWMFKHDDISDMDTATHFTLINGQDVPCICNLTTFDMMPGFDREPIDVVTVWMSFTVNDYVTFGNQSSLGYYQEYTKDFSLSKSNYHTVNDAITNEFMFQSDVTQYVDGANYMSIAYGPYLEDYRGASTRSGNNPSIYQYDMLAGYQMNLFFVNY